MRSSLGLGGDEGAWIEAGLTDEEGWLGKSGPLTGGPVLPRYVELNKGLLFYSGSWDPGKEAPPKDDGEAMQRALENPKASTAKMLDVFIAIRDEAAVERFAKRYGVLDMCKHGIPSGHNPPRSFLLRGTEFCLPIVEHYMSFETPESWLVFVKHACALLRIGASVLDGKPGSEEDWMQVYSLYWKPDDVELREGLANMASTDLDAGRSFLAERINEWLTWGCVKPSLSWSEGRPRFALAGRTFGVLGVQLLTAVTRTHGVSICDGCAKTYLREGRKPQAGRRNFCLDCGEPTASRLRQQDWARKQEGGGRDG